MSPWVMLVRVVDSLEGIIGVLINSLVLILIWRKKFHSNMLTFRIAITITAIQGVALAGIVAGLANSAHLFHKQKFIQLVFSPLAFVQNASRILVPLSVCIQFFSWQLIPGACVLQYLALCKPHFSTIKRLAIAYGICLAMILWSARFYNQLYSSPAFDAITTDVYGLASGSFVARGAELYPTAHHKICILSLAIVVVLPTYAISYAIFAWTMRKSRNALGAIGVRISGKTLSLHKKFMIMLLAQNLLPLVILSIPTILFYIVVASGYELDIISLTASFSLWLLPIVQGAVALRFILQTTKGVAQQFSLNESS